MKTNSPKRIIVYISLIAAFLNLGILLAFMNSLVNLDWLIMVISVLSVFIIIYGVSNFLIYKFFADTINPIYKIIRTVKLHPGKIEQELEESNFNKSLESEVEKWAQEKTRQIAQLRQNERYRKEFLGDVSHELKTPIFTIQGYISTLIDGGIDDPNINKKYLLRTEKSIDRMISIVEDLLSISQLEAGQLQTQNTVFNISEMVEEIIDIQEVRAKEKSISLSLKTQKLDLYNVKADKKLIYQVLLNLIVNSIIYGKVGGTTEITIYNIDKLVMVDVSDDGIGISKQDIHRIFERFYRVDKSRSKEHGGTGLGLSICKHILEAHQHSINVNSQVGFGSSFSFTLDGE